MLNHCDQRLRLSDVVVKAVHAVYQARNNQQEAIAKKQDPGAFAKLVLDARDAERIAVRALEEHRKRHGCKA